MTKGIGVDQCGMDFICCSYAESERRMIMKRKLFTMLLIALLCLGNTMAAFAVTNNSNTDELRKNMIIDSHIEALLNGEIDAKHRDSDTDINIKLGEVEKAPLIGEMPQYGTFEEQDINLIKQDVTVDTFKLDGNKEEYLATFIVNSKYEKKVIQIQANLL